MARRWAAEEKQAPAPAAPRDFTALLTGGLVGISDRVLADHLELYRRYVVEMAELDAVAGASARSTGGLPAAEAHQLLVTPVRDLPLLEPTGKLAEAIAQVEGELQDRGITWRPSWYVGDSDFWTADQAVSINLPWYLASDALWALVNDNFLRYSVDDVLRILRHELGHALGYAYLLYQRIKWGETFGNFAAPYQDDFTPDPAASDAYVSYIAQNASAPLAHYGQKHPDEDWAETFACWLDPGSRWRETYADRPAALAKLLAVEDMLVGQGMAYGPAPIKRVGRRVPFTALDFTVGEFLGREAGPSPADAARRRLPAVHNAVVLHELYFEGLARGAGAAGPGPAFTAAAVEAFGSVDAWAADFRQAARAAASWVLAVRDGRGGRLRNMVLEGDDSGAPANAPVIVALDAAEHAWMPDYGLRKDAYVAAWWRNVAWGVVEARVPPLLLPVSPLAVPAGVAGAVVPPIALADSLAPMPPAFTTG